MKMKTFEKILNVLARNLGYTIVLIVAIILFAYFSNGLIEGAITALSALVGYACILQLFRDYKRASAPRSQPAKKPAAHKSAPKRKK